MLLVELIWTFVIGGLGYGAMELLWRGYSHWTMLIAGGICLSLMYLISTRTHWKFWMMSIASAVIITTVEFVVGAVVNVYLGWGVWDYSYVLGNLCGQICLPYCLIWLAISVPAISICKHAKRAIFR